MQIARLSLLLLRCVHVLKKVVLVALFIWVVIGVAVAELSQIFAILIFEIAFINFNKLGILWSLKYLDLYNNNGYLRMDKV